MDRDDGVKNPRAKSPIMGVSGLGKEHQKTSPNPDDGRRSSGGILRLEPGKTKRRSSNTSVDLRVAEEGDPSSPCPSDRLSVTWADGERSVSSDTSVGYRVKDPSNENPSVNNLLATTVEDSPENHSTTKTTPFMDTNLLVPTNMGDDDDDLCASISVIMERSNTRKSLKKRRRGSSFGRRLTRTSTRSDSCSDTVVDVESSSELAKEQLRVYREVLTGVKEQAWPISRKLKLGRCARAYLKENEGLEEERLAQSTSTRDIFYRYFRYAKKSIAGGLIFFWNWLMNLELWYGRFKNIESHFGSAVASYFYFLRWVMGLNAILVVFLTAFVIIPEFLAASRANTGERKFMLCEERQTGYDFKVLWNFEGMFRYSPFFYGYYSRAKSTAAGYTVPEAYFLTFVIIFAFSFVMIVRKMTANQKQSKLSYDKTEFAWSLLAGWDYAIGNLEAAQNKVASINMGFKELLQGAEEKQNTVSGWKLIASRILAHFLVLCLLMSSAYAVVLLVLRSKLVDETYSWWRQNELSVILALISQIYPNLFKVVSRLEHQPPNKEVQLQLARIMVLNLLNLTTFTMTLYENIQSMNDEGNKIKKGLEKECKALQSISSDGNEDYFTGVGNDSLEMINATVSTILTTVIGIGVYNSTFVFNNTANVSNKEEWLRENCKRVAIPCVTDAAPSADEYSYSDYVNDTDEVISSSDFTTISSFLPVNVLNFTSIGEDMDPYMNSSTEKDHNNTENYDLLFRSEIGLGNSSTALPDIVNSDRDNDNNYIAEYSYYYDEVEPPLIRKKRQFDYNTHFSGNSIYNIPRNYDTVERTTTSTTVTTDETSDPNRVETTDETSDPNKVETTDETSDPNRVETTDETSDPNRVETTDETSDFNRVETLNETSDSNWFEFTNVTSNFNRVETTDGISDLNLVETLDSIAVIGTAETTSYSTFTSFFEGEDANDLMANETHDYNLLNNSLHYRDSSNSTHSTDYSLPSSTEANEIEEFESTLLPVKMAVVPSDVYPSDEIDSLGENIYPDDELAVPECYRYVCGDPELNTDFPNSTYENLYNVTEYDYNNTDGNTSIATEMGTTEISESVNHLEGIFPWKSPEKKKMEIPLDDLEQRMCSKTEKDRKVLRKQCWETIIGQEIVKITVMDLVITIVVVFITEYFRALVVRFCNMKNCCWDLEKQYPGYADFDIAENIFHLINNQGVVWMGMFFSPCLPALNLIKLVILLYVRSWSVVTSNVPPETVYKASDNVNFYLLLFLAMLFLCMLPVWFTMIIIPPSWHCGPFSEYQNIYDMFPVIDTMTLPIFVVPLFLLLVMGILYFTSLTHSLREANTDLWEQLCHERNEERKKTQEAITGTVRSDTPSTRWNKLLPSTPLPGRTSISSIVSRTRLPGTSHGHDDLQAPLLLENEGCDPQSPPGDDFTDLGQSEVFDDSIMSDIRKISADSMGKVKKASLEGKMPRKKTSKDSIKNKPMPKETTESTGSAESSQPKTPKMKPKPRNYFNYPDSTGSRKISDEIPTFRPKDSVKVKYFNGEPKISRPKDTKNANFVFEEPLFRERKEPNLLSKAPRNSADEPPTRERMDSRSSKKSKIYESPEKAANNEFIYTDFSKRQERPTTPSLKKKERIQKELQKEIDKMRQSPGKQSFEPLTGKESFPIILDKIKAKTRSGSEKLKKSFDSPSRKKRGSKDKGLPAVVVEIHGPDKESLEQKDSLPLVNVQENDEMQTIPLIKISKQDSVERSIEQAKLERQKTLVVEDASDPIPMADDSDASIVYETKGSDDVTNGNTCGDINCNSEAAFSSTQPQYESEVDESSDTYTILTDPATTIPADNQKQE